MADARLLRTTLEITADGPDGPGVFAATGKAIQFAGFLRAYVEGTDDPAAELGDQETLLPKLAVGDQVHAPIGSTGPDSTRSTAKGHETAPPPRYTDASLVKRSRRTASAARRRTRSIISTIERRGYVWRQGKALVPSFTAYAVTQPAQGALRRARRARLHRPDRGGSSTRSPTASATAATSSRVLHAATAGLAGPRAPRRGQGTGDRLPGHRPRRASRVGPPVVVRIGRFGPYVQIGEGDDAPHASVPERDRRRPISRSSARSSWSKAEAEGPESLGDDPKTRPAGLRDARPLRPVRAARRDAREGQQGEADARLADRDDDPDTITLDRRAPAPVAAARASGPTRTPARRSSPTSAATART